MYLNFIRKPQILAFLPFFSEENPYDSVDNLKNDEELSNDTAIYRLRNLFRSNYATGLNPLLVSTTHVASVSFVVGGVYGGIRSSRNTFINFIENNEATLFRNHYEAKRKLSDQMLLSFSKGFISLGSRISFFCTTFMLAFTLSSVFLNKNSVFNYTFGGLCSGAVFKSNLGPRGMVSGGIFGGLVGTAYGALKVCLLYVTQMSEKDFVDKRLELKQEREIAIADAKRKVMLKEMEKELMEQLSK